MATTTLPAFLDALAAALVLRAGLAGVAVFTCPVRPEELGDEAIELADTVEVAQGRAAMSSTDVEESYEVKGSVIVFRTAKPGASAINTAAKAARDRATAIIEEVTDEVSGNATMSATVRDVTIAAQSWSQGYAPENQLGRFCRIEFTLRCEAHVTP